MSPLVPNNGTKWDLSTSRSGRFTPWKEPRYPLNRGTGWVPEQVQTFGAKRELSCICPNSNPGPSTP